MRCDKTIKPFWGKIEKSDNFNKEQNWRFRGLARVSQKDAICVGNDQGFITLRVNILLTYFCGQYETKV